MKFIRFLDDDGNPLHINTDEIENLESDIKDILIPKVKKILEEDNQPLIFTIEIINKKNVLCRETRALYYTAHKGYFGSFDICNYVKQLIDGKAKKIFIDDKTSIVEYES